MFVGYVGRAKIEVRWLPEGGWEGIMKKIFGTAFALMLFSSSAWGLMIKDPNAGIYDGTIIGTEDTFIKYTDDLDNSKPGTEEDWVNKELSFNGETTTYTVKTEPVPYYNTDITGIYAFKLAGTDVGYFVIKNAKYWALFKNVYDFDWGVFNVSSLPPEMNLPSGSDDIGDKDYFQISHVTEFGGTPPIPEPATLLLFGAGLAGLAAVGRRKTK